jgi:gliding motility-associated-like protein/uncharacterized repeat protein (TIGR01451 family)
LSEIISILSPGRTEYFNTEYTVTQSDVETGHVDNTATASFTYSNVDYNEQATETVNLNLVNDITITKIPDETSFDNSGDVLNYTITVTNTGNVALTNLTVSDPLTGLNETLGTLNSGEIQSFNTSYTVTQADVNRGYVDNTTTASYVFNGNPYSESASAHVPSVQGPALDITKDADETSFSGVGDIINYTIVVTNTGNVTLTEVQVSDPLTGLDDIISTLAPEASQTYNTTYSVTQNDINNGYVNNTASATSVFGGVTYSDTDSERVNGNQNNELTITKVATESGFSGPNQTLHYTITVTNTGNVTLNDVVVTDPLTILNSTITELLPGADNAVVITTTYSTTLNDMNVGFVNNTATATYTFNGNSYSESDSENVPANQNPSISITKSSVENSYTRADEIIHYSLTITNTGNVTLSNVTASDPNAVVTCNGSPYTLAPNASVSCTATHTVTGDDVAAGSIENTATASGYSPVNQRVEDNSNLVVVPLDNQAPSIICPPPIETTTSQTTCDRYIDSGLSATISDPNDNIVSLTWVMTGATTDSSPSTGINNLTSYTFNRGVTIITYTVTDGGGLSASCSFTVTVIDIVPPTITCVEDQHRSTDIDGPIYTTTGTEFDPVSLWDNCTIASVTNDFNDGETLNGAQFPIGETTVVWTVVDNSGNSANCSFTVTVADEVPPVVRCKDITIYIDLVTGIVSITPIDVDGGSFDNVGIASMTIDRDTFNCEDLGQNNVTLTVTDVYGNSGACVSVVTVLYAVLPEPVATPSEDIICNGDITDLALTSNIPATTWTWTINASGVITGAKPDNTGTLSVIRQTLTNNSPVAQNVVYTITPTVYGRCELDPITAEVWVNPTPGIIVSPNNSIICMGASTDFTVLNPNSMVRGDWMYDLTVTPDPGIGGYRGNETFTEPTNFTETLTNSDRQIHKVVYTFTPRIRNENDGSYCTGPASTVTIWVRPAIRYTLDISDYNGYNVSCYDMSDGYIKLDPAPESIPLTYSWIGPDGFTSTKEDLTGLVAGEYTLHITDQYQCTTDDTVNMIEPGKFGMILTPSISNDGAYNINCAGDKTGTVNIEQENGVGRIEYLWSDGEMGYNRTDMAAGTYRIILVDANNCTAESTISLTQPTEITTTFDVKRPFCPEMPDGEIKVNASGGVPASDGYTYFWSTNLNGTNILPDIREGNYSVIVGDANGCKIIASTKIKAYNELCLIIPEAFSPNGDLVNDTWIIGNTELYPNMVITIYNRWGQFIWKSAQGYPIPWDGKYEGQDLPIDGYHYVIDLHNGAESIAGAVTIVR